MDETLCLLACKYAIMEIVLKGSVAFATRIDDKLYKIDWLSVVDVFPRNAANPQTAVHELLHLKLSLVSDQVEALQARYMHQIIDDLARAFVGAKREKAEVEE